ncbi:sulfurase, partial [Staphylococcus epidermidis]
MKLISVNVAQVGPLFGPVPANGRQVATAIHKQPVAGPVAVGRLGLDGDA